MKKILFILLVGMMAVHATAQPAKRKAEQKTAATTTGAISTRAHETGRNLVCRLLLEKKKKKKKNMAVSFQKKQSKKHVT